MTRLTALALASILSAPAHAATFNSGAVEVVNSAIPTATTIENDTDVNLVDGGNVSVPAGGSFGDTGVLVKDTSSLTIDGGTVAGGNGNAFAGTGIFVEDQASLTLRRGQVDGSFLASDGTSLTNFGGDGVDFRSTGPLRISGGTIKGGDADAFAGAGLDISNASDAQITGGTFLGGRGSSNPSGSFGGEGVSIDESQITITGGSFSGGTGETAAGHGLEVDGDDSFVTILGGSFFGTDTEGLDDNHGSAVYADEGRIDIFGGSFDAISAPALDIDTESLVNMFGGTFVGGISIAEGSTLNVFGQKLSFEDGVLTGSIRGNLGFSIDVTLDEGGSLNLIPAAIPVPASLPLIAAGLGALAIFGKPRRTTRCGPRCPFPLG